MMTDGKLKFRSTEADDSFTSVITSSRTKIFIKYILGFN